MVKIFFLINCSSWHSVAYGVLRLILKLKCEKVIKADLYIGLLYRGIENLIEYKTCFKSMPYFDRLDYMLMIAQENTFCLAIEYLLKNIIMFILIYLYINNIIFYV